MKQTQAPKKSIHYQDKNKKKRTEQQYDPNLEENQVPDRKDSPMPVKDQDH